MNQFPERLVALQPFWGAWRLDSAIGEGSYGKVYRIVRQDELGTAYYSALKWIALPQHQGEVRDRYSEGMDEASIREYYNNMVRGLQTEVVLMNRLRGTSYVVGFEDHAYLERKDEIGWDVLIRMELLQSLPDRIIAGMTVRDVVQMGLNLCDALILCGKHDIVHRDIKPDNIFYSSNGDYKLGDFGVARQMSRAMTNMSRKGTPFFMAPEVYLEKPSNRSVDQYSLGLVMHRLLNAQQIPLAPLTNRALTHPEREQAFQARIKGTPIPPPLQGSAKLKLAVAKACSFQPKKRFSGPEAFRDALRACLIDKGLDEPLQMGFTGQSRSNRSSVSLNDKGQTGGSGGKKPTLKTAIVALSVAVVALVGVGVYMLMQPPAGQPVPTEARMEATVEPTANPETAAPTISPTTAATEVSTAVPTVAPTAAPTIAPTTEPTAQPTNSPTIAPTTEPTAEPTVLPTAAPTPAPALLDGWQSGIIPMDAQAIAMEEWVRVAAKPDASSGTRDYYARGEQMVLTGEVIGADGKQWYQTLTWGGRKGYVPAAAVSIADAEGATERPLAVAAVSPTPVSAYGLPDAWQNNILPLEAQAQVSAIRALVRSLPDTSSDNLGVYARGEQLPVTGEVTGADGQTWYEVHTRDGRVGYVRASTIHLLATATDTPSFTTQPVTASTAKSAAGLPQDWQSGIVPLEAQAQVSAIRALVRALPDTSSDNLGVYARGEQVPVTGEVTGADGQTWYEVHTRDGRVGYVRASAVHLLATGTDIPAFTTQPVAASTPKPAAAPTPAPEKPWQSDIVPIDARAVAIDTLVRVWASPGGGTTLGYFAQGEELVLSGELPRANGNQWYQTHTRNNLTGYVPAASVRIMDAAEAVETPPVTPTAAPTPSSAAALPTEVPTPGPSITPTEPPRLVTFGNVGLERSIRQQAGLAPDEPFTQDRAAQVQTLDIRGAHGDGDIRFLRYFTGLTSLTIYGSNVSNLQTLAALTNLTELNLLNNRLADLRPLAGLSNLQSLHLDNNLIHDLSPLSSLINLRFLYIRNNQVQEVSALTGLGELHSLYIRDNPVRLHSPLSVLPKLVSSDFTLLEDSPGSHPDSSATASRLTIKQGKAPGIALVSWQGKADKRYKITCQIAGKNPIDPQLWDRYSLGESVSFGPLLPGATYIITVENLVSGKSISKNYKVPAAERFLETTSRNLDVAFYISDAGSNSVSYSTSARVSQLKRIAESVTQEDLSRGSAFGPVESFWLMHNIVNGEMDTEMKSKSPHVQHSLFVVHLPNGHVYVLADKPGFEPAWEYDTPPIMLRRILDHYGRIPTGTWRVEVYYDMKLAGKGTLRVQ